MLKTSKWDTFVRDGQISPEHRHYLATAPLPAVRVHRPVHGTHAVGSRRRASDTENPNESYVSLMERA